MPNKTRSSHVVSSDWSNLTLVSQQYGEICDVGLLWWQPETVLGCNSIANRCHTKLTIYYSKPCASEAFCMRMWHWHQYGVNQVPLINDLMVPGGSRWAFCISWHTAANSSIWEVCDIFAIKIPLRVIWLLLSMVFVYFARFLRCYGVMVPGGFCWDFCISWHAAANLIADVGTESNQTVSNIMHLKHLLISKLAMPSDMVLASDALPGVVLWLPLHLHLLTVHYWGVTYLPSTLLCVLAGCYLVWYLPLLRSSSDAIVLWCYGVKVPEGPCWDFCISWHAAGTNLIAFDMWEAFHIFAINTPVWLSWHYLVRFPDFQVDRGA